ncbi:MAG: carbon monoxide dehydrogenase [Porticoccaceae bacterium]|nr:MAG: carbon monoxide dehydrogenase [Porticoccaceae bacterium]
MEMTEKVYIAASPEVVYDGLNNPEILKQAVPGCEEFIKNSDTDMTMKIKSKVGPIKANFNFKVTLSELIPPSSYKIYGEGQGGAAGFAKGGATVKLEPEGNGTMMYYTVSVDVGGKLAQLGSRLIDGTAKKMAGQFFSNFGEIICGTPESAPEEVLPLEMEKARTSWTIWVGVAAIAGAAVVAFMMMSRA